MRWHHPAATVPEAWHGVAGWKFTFCLLSFLIWYGNFKGDKLTYYLVKPWEFQRKARNIAGIWGWKELFWVLPVVIVKVAYNSLCKLGYPESKSGIINNHAGTRGVNGTLSSKLGWILSVASSVYSYSFGVCLERNGILQRPNTPCFLSSSSKSLWPHHEIIWVSPR